MKLVQRFYNFFNFFWFFSTLNLLKENEFYRILPKKTKQKISYELFADILLFDFASFFGYFPNEIFLERIAQELKPKLFEKGATVIKKNTISIGIYFILLGRVNIQYQNGPEKIIFRKLKQNSFFGEFFLLNKKSPFSFICSKKEDLKCLFISKGNFIKILNDFKDLSAKMKDFISQRDSYIDWVHFYSFRN